MTRWQESGFAAARCAAVRQVASPDDEGLVKAAGRVIPRREAQLQRRLLHLCADRSRRQASIRRSRRALRPSGDGGTNMAFPASSGASQQEDHDERRRQALHFPPVRIFIALPAIAVNVTTEMVGCRSISNLARRISGSVTDKFRACSPQSNCRDIVISKSSRAAWRQFQEKLHSSLPRAGAADQGLHDHFLAHAVNRIDPHQ